jgi:DNA-binding MarR family transcriptional regulator
MSPSKTEFIEPIDAPNRRRLPMLLRRSWYGLNQAFRRRIAHLQITPDQFTVLRTLLESDTRGLTQRELARTISSDPNTIASLLERMDKLGYVECLPHERDRRAHRIKVLPKGKKAYESARDIAVALQGEVLSGLPAGGREAFLENLSLVADACRLAAENRSPEK